MALNLASISRTKYYPELLPDAQYLNLAGGVINVLDIRRYDPKIVHFGQFATENSAAPPSAELRIENDRQRYNIGTDFAYPQRTLENFDIVAADYLKVDYYGVFVNQRIYYNMWVYEPTVAHKILFKKELTAFEKELSEKYKIEDEVKKGLLPLKFDYIMDREYQLVDGKRVFTYMDGAFDVTEATIQSFPARPNEIVVLESISASTGGIVNPRVRIDRDSDYDYLEMPTLAFNDDVNLPCFVPALSELRIKVISNAIGAGSLRYTLSRYKLNDILRARFNLVSRDEIDPEIYDKVKAGVL